MKQFNYTITDEQGIHARPAGDFVKVAKGYESKITITSNGKSADAKKIFGVMGLAVKQGNTIEVTVDGADEDAAVAALEEFLKNNL